MKPENIEARIKQLYLRDEKLSAAARGRYTPDTEYENLIKSLTSISL